MDRDSRHRLAAIAHLAQKVLRRRRIVDLLVASTLSIMCGVAAPTAARRDALLPLAVFYSVAGDDEAKALAAL